MWTLRRLLALLMLISGAAYAAEPQRPDLASIDINTSEDINLLQGLAWCAADTKLEVVAISAGGCQFSIVKSQKDLKQGLSPLSFWLTFSLQNSSAAATQRYLRIGHPRLQSVTLYTQSNDYTWEGIETGLNVPARDRPVLKESPTFHISIAGYSTNTYFVRIASETAIDMSATIMTTSSLITSNIYSHIILYFALGAAALASCFSLIVFRYLRDISLLYFAGAIIAIVINDAGYTGALSTFFWPRHYAFPISIQGITASVALMCFAAFVMALIPDHNRLKPLRFAIFSLYPIFVFLAFWSVWHNYRDVLPYLTVFAGILVLLLSTMIGFALRLKISINRLLVWALLPIFLIIIIRMMSVLGLSPPEFLYSTGFSWILVLVSPIIISGIAQAGDSQKKMLAEFEADAQIRSQFLSHMSHDFRSPLSTIIRYADLVERGSERVRSNEAMVAIRNNSYDLLAMIDGILDYVRRDSVEAELCPSDTQLDAFIQEISVRAHYLCKLNGNSFEININGKLPSTIRIDKARLRQVLNNFISNANNYTKSDKIIFTCDAKSIDHDNCQITFSVRDNGIGIDKLEHNSIFEPHIRGRNARNSGVEGFGIGLALAKTIVGKMGSDIKLESYPGKGSTFSFTITCGAAWQINRDDFSSRQTGKVYTFLFVDDDPADLAYLCDLLAPYDVEILTAASASEANLCWQKSVDLVITDQFMANGDGWDLLEQASRHNVPAIMMSAADPLRPKNLSASLEFAAIFRKPVEDDAVIDVIDRLVGGLRRRAEVLSKEPMKVLLQRPAAALLAPLQKMMEEGAVTAIESWLLDVEQKHPDHNEFWSQVREAHLKLDFDEMQKLIEG